MPPSGPAILVATGSGDKLGEIRRILAFTGLQVLGLADLATPVPAEPEEPFESFLDNAAHKAAHYARLTGRATLADDSGLSVDALRGQPGVRSKRFSGRTDLTGQALDDENNRTLLARLAGVPAGSRDAHYVCAAALAAADGRLIAAAIGVRHGHILEEPRGSAGFGYDPLFLVPELGRSFGEVAANVKNAMSHRARAFRAVAAQLPALLAGLAAPRP